MPRYIVASRLSSRKVSCRGLTVSKFKRRCSVRHGKPVAGETGVSPLPPHPTPPHPRAVCVTNHLHAASESQRVCNRERERERGRREVRSLIDLIATTICRLLLSRPVTDSRANFEFVVLHASRQRPLLPAMVSKRFETPASQLVQSKITAGNSGSQFSLSKK